MFLQLLLGMVLFLDSYLLIIKMREMHLQDTIHQYMNQKNEKYYTDMLKYYEKSKKIKLKTKMGILQKLSLRLNKAGIQCTVFINPITMLLFSLLSFGVSYWCLTRFFKVITLSMFLSIPALFIPILVLQMIEERNDTRIEKASLNFLLQLKNYTQINNDIVYAMGEVKTIEPLQSNIQTFLLELNRGIHFEVAIEHFKEKLNNETIKTFLSNVQYCYLYGGSFPKLITKSYYLLSDLQKEKEKRIQETKSARLVLYILILLDILVYMVTIQNNTANHIIMQKTMIGRGILYWNFFSMWLLVLLANQVKKLDY